jgi:hypothetical protein
MIPSRSAVLRFVKWASMRGRDHLDPIEIPQLSRQAKGVPAIQGRAVTKVDRAEVLAILQPLPLGPVRTTSRYFNARERAATAALRARTAADQALETDRMTGTDRIPGSSEIILPQKKGDGRVAQLDRALPSGAAEKSTISCKNRGILISVGSQKSEQKRAETHDNWNCASYENLDRARRVWGALRVI